MSSAAGWDDLFVAAAGSATNQKNTAHAEVAGAAISEDQPRKKKRKKIRPTGGDVYALMLSSRINDTGTKPGIPSWLRLGSSLQSIGCKGWVETDTITENDTRGFRVCKVCNLSPMYHRVDVDFSRVESPAIASAIPKDIVKQRKHEKRESQRSGITGKKKRSKYDGKEAPFRIFAALRNIRCCGSIAAERIRADKPCTEYTTVSLDRANQIMAQYEKMVVPAGEADILRGRCQSLKQKVVNWVHEAKGLSHGLGKKLRFFEMIVEVIMACDALYYRLYYLQITVPTFGLGGSGSAGNVFISHPTTYFGDLAFDVASGESCLDDLVNDIIRSAPADTDKRMTEVTSCFAQHGITHLAVAEKEIDKLKCSKPQHPLEYLHYLRFLETIFLFWASGWAQSEEITKQLGDTLRSLKHKPQSILTESDFYAQHETPAVPLLSKFRDSSRDFPCNIYAYASVPSSSMVKLKEVLIEKKMTNGIVEVGAGTGYIAHLLKESGLQVNALDLAPINLGPENIRQSTEKPNEYHGSTPGFVHVQRSDVTGLNMFLRSRAIASKTALLLCYPPPLSSMAEDALHSFTSIGGRCLIHIGEFQGLTGSHRFEDSLVKSWHCVDRLPCLLWGTDAANITVWVKTSDGNDRREMHSETCHDYLLPCSNCFRAPAVRRCRLERSLVYCGHKCFELHSRIRRVHLALHMIFLECNYDDNRHFVQLDSYVAGIKGEKARDSHTGEKRRRAKKKR